MPESYRFFWYHIWFVGAKWCRQKYYYRNADHHAYANGIYLLSLSIHIPLTWSPVALAGVVLSIVHGAALFSTFSLMVACIVKTRERFMGIGQVLTMPLFFASNAIYPISIMPGWLKVIAHLNPLSYQVDILRALMVMGGSSNQ